MSDFAVGDRVGWIERGGDVARGVVRRVYGPRCWVGTDDGLGGTVVHVSDLTHCLDAPALSIGDRVRWTNENGVWTGEVRVREPWGVYVREDTSGGMMAFSARTRQTLTRIEEPQPWQGECRACEATIDAMSACLATPWPRDYPTYYCLACWEELCGALPGKVRNVTREQEAALATSREWMHERHPDDPRWQEAER